MDVILIVFLVFFTTAFFIYGVFLTFTASKRELSKRMKTYTSKIGELGLRANSVERLKNVEWKSMFQEASRVFVAKSFAKKMEVELLRADIPLRGEEFIMVNILLMIGLGLAMMVLTANIVLGCIGVTAGFFLPRMWVKRIKTKRVLKFNSQIGDALMVMSNSMRAGFSFLQAMEMVSREMPSPISDEFARSLREMNLGTPTEEALTNLTKRIESEDLDLVVTAVMIQRQVGGNLAEVLDGISHTIRERIRIKGEIKTLTAQGRISGIVVGLLPVVMGLILAVINPSYISTLFTNPMGWALLTAGAISQTIGIALIKKTVDVKV